MPPAPPPRRRGIRFAAVAAVAAAIVAAVAVTWAGVPGIRRSTPQPATADTVLARVQHALASLNSISGDVVEYGSARGRPYSHRVGSFTFTSRGDYRIVQTGENVTYTYDAVKRVARRYVFRDGEALYRTSPATCRTRARSSAPGWAPRRCSTGASPPMLEP